MRKSNVDTSRNDKSNDKTDHLRGVASPDCPGGKVGELPGGALAPIARLRTQGGVPPSEAGKFWNFDTEFTQFSDNFYAKFIPLEMFKYL